MRVVAIVFLAAASGAGGEWHSLFDGRTPSGWEEVTGKPFPSECWRVENGCLRTVLTKGSYEDIRTVEVFRSFEFEFEWQVEAGGNSGVKYLVQHTDEWLRGGYRQARARGLEYQLCDDSNGEARADPSRGTAALYSVLAPVGKHVQPHGEFEVSRIVVNGRRVEHWLNGVKVLSYTLDDAPLAPLLHKLQGPAAELRTEAPITLQHHGSVVWFRRLRVRRLE